jgi:CRISPR/Cas system-associated exonuclease Cas4 (RecB family)
MEDIETMDVFDREEWSAVDACNQGMLRLNEEHERKVPTSWNASRVGYCPCGVYLERMGAEPDKEFDTRTLGMFKMGHKVEEVVVEQMEASREVFLVEQQARVEIPELDVTGYADLLVNDEVVVEVKSVHSFKFNHLKKEGAQKMHLMQTWLYLYGLDKEQGRVLYVGRDDNRKMEYVVRKDDKELEKEVRAEIGLLQRAWDEKIPPPPAEDWRGKYCSYHKQCLAQPEYLSS